MALEYGVVGGVCGGYSMGWSKVEYLGGTVWGGVRWSMVE